MQRSAVLTFLVAVMVTACGAPSEQATPPSTTVSAIGPAQLPENAVVDYQLSGGYLPDATVTVVTRDSTDVPAPGIYSICYVNGFQSQPGVEWPSELVLHDGSGLPLIDENWPDENILDISGEKSRIDTAALIGQIITTCADKGFQAVEFDNFDSFTRSDNQLTEDEAIAFAKTLVELAHNRNLAAGQKNAADLVERGRAEVGFDFAVAEECDQFQECGNYTDAYGSQVIDIEYSDSLRRPFQEFCADPARPAASVLRDRKLLPAGSPGHVLQFCAP